MRPIGILAGFSFAFFATLAVAAPEYNPVRKQPAAQISTQRLIVKLRSTSSNPSIQSASASATAMKSLAARAKVTVKQSRALGSQLHVMQWEPQVSGESSASALERLRADAAVEWAVPDQKRYAQAAPNDPLFAGQWWLQNAQPAASDAVTAWDTTTGSNGVVIAVLDTGIRYGHTDLRTSGSNRLLPGYDFVSGDPNGGFLTANDGGGPDSDPSDPGDWVTTDDVANSPFPGCQTADSSWHGARVAGMIGALSNNSSGVSGMTWSGWILPLRVLGKCGGWDSDILTAMLWAAGVSIDGIPDNPYPAKVQNLSLGSDGACSVAYQQVMAQLNTLGVLVIASAGNSGGFVGTPANCPGVAAISGIRHIGTKVGFSSLGPQIALSAPGGNCVTTGAGQPCQFSLDTTSNSGLTAPSTSSFTNTDQNNANFGTSFASPIVSGIAGLMLAVNGNLKRPQLIARLREGAVAFPTSSDATIPTCHVPQSGADIQNTECNCTTQTCGAGMANAARSVAAALRPIAAVAVPDTVSAGQSVTLDASGSAAACNHSVSTYEWTTVSGTNPTGISGADTPNATVIAPATGSYTVRVTVTDESGKQDMADVVVSSNSASTTAPSSAGTNACLTAISYSAPSTPADGTPAPSNPDPTPATNGGGGGGGGGALDLIALIVLLTVLAASRKLYLMRVAQRAQQLRRPARMRRDEH